MPNHISKKSHLIRLDYRAIRLHLAQAGRIRNPRTEKPRQWLAAWG